jgi:O-antigen/teichoic acid export membrane protein
MDAESAPIASADLPVPGGAAAPGGTAAPGGSPFARRVGGVFATRIVQFALALPTSILISRLLGPTDKGAYVAVTTLPGMLSALGLLGLPSAVNYFAGRGSSVRSLTRASILFTLILSLVLIGIVWVSLPWLETSFLRAAPDDLARVILVTVPTGMLASFGGTILYGRQTIRTYNVVLIVQSATTLVAAVVFVGVLHLGVVGAVAGTILSSTLLAAGVATAVLGLQRRDRSGHAVSLRSLISYGGRLYPASVTGYFNYRADTYLIQALLLAPGRALGLYSIAVTFAELIFYVPDSISTMLLPRVAGASAADASVIVGRVGRLTMLITSAAAVALIPAAIVGIHVVLPAYIDSIPAFLVLLPGVVSLSLAKIMTSYISGRGRPGIVSVGAIAALVLNISLNLVLIPMLGIVGASLASLASYTALATMMLVAAGRLAGAPVRSLFLPGAAELNLLATGFRRLRAGGPNRFRPVGGPDRREPLSRR